MLEEIERTMETEMKFSKTFDLTILRHSTYKYPVSVINIWKIEHGFIFCGQIFFSVLFIDAGRKSKNINTSFSG